eukprot:CAMPEP_0115750690 /NCGR_PEP_ID=MMETSP0272-20121206/94867_1 /TAXON_ID=71861 /ORGANISM="Scrippsiella trochoidea, Strain CCMP3099" /LENGTH=173 /DNA_ID=CAMNT_0003195839 /DNA_START=31 /DNA_END=549 /DNA_ORIENTATION=+
MISADPEGGTRFTTVAVVDPKIPFMPKWVINIFIPSEMRKFIVLLNENSHALKQAGIKTPCASFFVPLQSSVPHGPGELGNTAEATSGATEHREGDPRVDVVGDRAESLPAKADILDEDDAGSAGAPKTLIQGRLLDEKASNIIIVKDDDSKDIHRDQLESSREAGAACYCTL